MSLQTKYLKHSGPVTPQEIKLVDAKVAAIKKVESWIEKMLSEQPIIASSAALTWLGHDHCRRNQDDPEWELPDWVVVYLDNDITRSDPTPLHEDNIRARLQSCLDFAPAKTIQSMTFASVMYEVIFSQPSLFNSIDRLENFLKETLTSWDELTIGNKDLQRIIEWSNLLYLKKVIGKNSQAYTFILSCLEVFFWAPEKDRNALETIISDWPKIVSADEKFFSKYKNSHLLNSAAREALSDEGLRNRLEIAEKIDYATNFHHSNLESRLKAYRKIDRLYTSRQTVQKPATQPVGFSLSVAELGTLDQLCVAGNLYQQEVVSKCIDHAYIVSKKGKKHIKLEADPFLPPALARYPIIKTTLRLSPDTKEKLTSLIRHLNKHKLGNGKAFSATTALGLAIHLYARSVLPYEISYKGPAMPHDGSSAGQLVKRDEAQPVGKPKRRKRDPGQSHAVRPKVPAETKTLEEPLETGSSKTANQPTAPEPQPASVDQPATQSYEQPEAIEAPLPAPASQPSQPSHQNVADQPPEEPGVQPQQASTAPLDGELEETQKNKVETEPGAAATPEEGQDPEPHETGKVPQEDTFKQRGSRSVSQDNAAPNPHSSRRSGRNDLRSRGWNENFKTKGKLSNKWQDE